jgi:DNA-binding CsgD family transcriptional regulator/tetratricopeptide (TPR) repeat protein
MAHIPVVTNEGAERAQAIRQPGFVGRAQELAALGEALASPPTAVMVEGEAGIGKTRLIREFLASTDGWLRALIANCPPFRQPHTLGPVMDGIWMAANSGVARLGLSDLAGALRPLFPEWAADLPPAPEPLGDATADRHRLFRALAELIGRLEVGLLIVEDAQWADDATLEFLLFIASLHHQHASLVVTYRPEDLAEGSLLLRLSSRLSAEMAGLRITLHPLDIAETGILASSLLGAEVISEDFVSFLYERTEGVPLAVEESVRLMADRGDVFCHNGRWVRRHLAHIKVPPTIRDAVLERFRRLGQDAQAVLNAVAVLADSVGEATLIKVTGRPAERVHAGLAEALGSSLLAGDSRGLSFRHALAGQTVYESIPITERRLLHLRAGRALEGTSPLPTARLARHFREAGETAEWCQYAEHAADLAIASGDVVSAVTLLHDMLANAQLDVRSVIRLTAKIPFPLFTGDSRFQDVVDALRSALDAEIADPAEEAELRFHLGRVLFLMEEFEAARGELERAVPHLSGKPIYAARAMMLLSWPRGPGRAGKHELWLRRAAEASASIGPLDRLRVNVDRATALLLLGEPSGWAEAAQIPDGAPTSQEMWEVTRGHLNIGHMAMMWGRYAEAEQRLARALDLASTNQYWRYHAMILGTKAHLDWFTGAWRGLAERAAFLAQSEDMPPVSRLEPLLVSAQLYAATGARAEARECLQLMCDQTRRRGVELECLEPSARLAGLLLADGDLQAALQITDWPIAVVAEKGTWLWATELAPARIAALVATGRVKQATDLTRAFARGLLGRKAPAPRAALTLCRAILTEAQGDRDRAGMLFARAAAAWRALPRPYDSLLARERQAECQLAVGQVEAALTLLSEVRQDLLELGATADADRAARSLDEHGVAVQRRWRGGRRGYGEQLSPRELEVVRLLALGHTSQEIARALFRSPKTVDTQVRSAMRKLRVSSRTALAVRVAETGVAVSDGLLGGLKNLAEPCRRPNIQPFPDSDPSLVGPTLYP